MSADIGRAAALFLAVVLVVVTPFCIRAGRTSGTESMVLQQAADEFADKVGLIGAVTLGDYERMLAAIARTGAVCSVEMRIGKKIARQQDPSLKRCAAHVHTADCYIGHNHEVCGCRYHNHSSACYCSGKYTRIYRTDVSETTCSKCKGKKWITEMVMCMYCRDPSNVRNPAYCPICDGEGWYLSHGPCPECEGNGYIQDTIIYYCCAKCGRGSTTSRGRTCGALTCGYAREGYECGIENNDTNPICGMIIVDASYEERQTLPYGSYPEDINRAVEFTYLDESSQICTLEIEDSHGADFSAAGTYSVDLSYTGYFFNAHNHVKNIFPAEITIEAPKPAVAAIRAESAKDIYEKGEAGQFRAFAVYSDADSTEQELAPEDFWDTFDSSIAGDQIVFIGYDRFVAQLEVTVIDPNGKTDDDPEDEITGDEGGDEGKDDDDDEEEDAKTGDYGGTDDDPVPIGPEDPPVPGYEDMLGDEEVLELLYSLGRIDLSHGDVFSVIITVEEPGVSGILSIHGRGKNRKYTAGAMIF